MLFLRLTIFIIIALGILIYLVSTKIRAEFLNTGGNIIPLFRGSNEEFKAFCKSPPTQYASKLLSFKKKISIALIIAVIILLLTILVVILEQA